MVKMYVSKENLIASEKIKKNQNKCDINQKPLKPKLSRKIVNSAKVNLNRYWSKFEEFLSPMPSHQTAGKVLMPILNNKVHPIAEEKQRLTSEINSFIMKKFNVEKNIFRGKYKHFVDDSLYHGVNLNAPEMSYPAGGEESSCSTCYCMHRHSYRKVNIVNPSSAWKGYKITFEEEDNYENEYREYFEDEGFLV